MNFRIGFGFDVHQLKEGADFYLGGTKITHTKGSIGYSDADVLIHAICDAILGAANLGDIGTHFPDDDTEFKGIDSKILLSRVIQLIIKEGYEISNIDSTVCLQIPKIKPYIPEMRQILSKCMGIKENQCSIKATTTETLGFTGRQEGVSAYATVLIYKK